MSGKAMGGVKVVWVAVAMADVEGGGGAAWVLFPGTRAEKGEMPLFNGGDVLGGCSSKGPDVKVDGSAIGSFIQDPALKEMEGKGCGDQALGCRGKVPDGGEVRKGDPLFFNRFLKADQVRINLRRFFFPGEGDFPFLIECLVEGIKGALIFFDKTAFRRKIDRRRWKDHEKKPQN